MCEQPCLRALIRVELFFIRPRELPSAFITFVVRAVRGLPHLGLSIKDRLSQCFFINVRDKGVSLSIADFPMEGCLALMNRKIPRLAMLEAVISPIRLMRPKAFFFWKELPYDSTPIKGFGYDDRHYEVKLGDDSSISARLKKALQEIKQGNTKESFGWVEKLA